MQTKHFAYLYLLFGVFGIIANLHHQTPQYLLWFCNHTALVIGLALLFDSTYWVQAEVNLALIPQLLWSIDFVTKLLFGFHPMNLTEYMFTPGYDPFMYLLGLSHIILVPVTLYILYHFKKEEWAWKGSAIHIAVLILLSLLIRLDYNINCMYEGCVPFTNQSGLEYQIFWPLFVLAMAAISNLLINKALSAVSFVFDDKA